MFWFQALATMAMMTVRTLCMAGLQSGTIMGVADVATQLVVDDDRHSDNSSWDYVRTLLRWSLVGVTLHGPYFAAGFARLDAIFGPATTITVVAQKTAAAQLFLFPPYLVLLFTYLGLLEGVEDVGQKVTQRVPAVFATGCVYWPVANAINFGLVPAAWRIPYLSTAAGVWNCYLSYTNAAEAVVATTTKPSPFVSTADIVADE
jgi:Mpv17 / PMP22 family